ncbi:MAG TPA: class I poly(R)-hydroxyalkanoic acid synthase [Burkholderiaceae bacterium]|nr:class I poly(R)-hydroxyalkanoic acid synthase [Burkholderiaceae bacterium]
MAHTMQAFAGLQLPTDELTRIQSAYLDEAALIWNRTLEKSVHSMAPAPNLADRRFASSEWTAHPMSGFVAALYLLNARTLMQMADGIQGDEKTRQRVRFAVQQWVDAAAPSNYLAFNPEALKKALDTEGQSIAQGLQHLWRDVQQGHVSQTDESVFEVGRNVATTEGAVVFENELFQLIEYKSLTAKVHERPMLFIPPCINKYYILDLQPDNSLIRYTVEQGHRVFVVSWRNPDASLAAKTWDDYIEHAAIKAIHLVQEIGKSETINTLGFCVGGTILATALSVLAARGEHPAQSMTLLTTFLDFSNTGVLDLFIDEAAVRMRELALGPEAPQGPQLLQGKELATTFSFLRPNDLVWNYVVGNYLKGETPPPFDLLYWNSDSTNLPGPMFCWYLRNTYLENNLRQPGKLQVCGQPVDLRAAQVPAYVYASREDHIVPWDAAYMNTQVLGGPVRFVLGASGHIAGVINPPAKKKRSHWIGANGGYPSQASQWLANAQEHPGSWWTDWAAWLKPLAGNEIAAPKSPGNRTYPPIEPAPGRYVKAKA